MALSSKEYWEKRSLARLTEAEKASIPYIRQVRKVYEESAKTIVESVKKMYAAYYSRLESDGTGRFDVTKLSQIVPSGDIKRLLADMKAAGLSTRLPSYYKGRMTRAKLLEAQMWAEVQKAADREQELSTESYKKTISHSYYRSIYDYSKLTSTDQTFGKLNDRSINRILNSKLAGDDYSNRIWKSSDKLAGSIKNIMGRAIATGQPLEKTVRDVRQRFDVKKYEAERLIRTETNYFENYAEMESYEEMEIDRFVFMATLDGRTSDICREMDGKIFKVKDAHQGDNVPPLHPYCRSTIAPYLGKEYLPKERRVRDPREDGKSQIVKFQSFQSWAKEKGVLVSSSTANKTKNLEQDKLTMKRIGVDERYWRNEMDSGERYFAERYPRDITWINRLQRDKNGKLLPTYDYILKETGVSYELKTVRKAKYHSIKEHIKRAVEKSGKKRFMINIKNQKLTDKLRKQLSNYNINNPENKISELWVFSRGEEERIVLHRRKK
jgi:SPP1 gp7 family putative phage head morphogenesis protein